MDNVPQRLEMPAPKASKPPMKANLFLAVQGANMQLLPMFPYDGPGDIVPCSVGRQTLVGDDHGRFWHENSVDEVMVCFGGNGQVRPGEVRAGAKTHGVGGTPSTAETFTVNCVTQRQSEDGIQHEAMVFICESCNEPVFRFEFDAQTTDGGHGVHPLATTEGSWNATRAWNADEATRTCKACGFANPPFPAHYWGWNDYMRRTQIAQAAQELLKQSAGR